jgi:hypothetical protein
MDIPAQHYNHRMLIALGILISFLIMVAVWLKLSLPSQSVLGMATFGPFELQTSARVGGCLLGITVYPEKRIPAVNNWGTILDVSIYDINHVHYASFTTTTDNQGFSLVDLCEMGYQPPHGVYHFQLRGYAHLRRYKTNYDAFAVDRTDINFSFDGTRLLAGETSNVFDNKINSLDISTQIIKLYTNDYKNDLNQDRKVNSLDLSNTIYNFYAVGE